MMRMQAQQDKLRIENERHYNVNKAKEAAELGETKMSDLATRYKMAVELGLPLANKLKNELEEMLLS